MMVRRRVAALGAAVIVAGGMLVGCPGPAAAATVQQAQLGHVRHVQYLCRGNGWAFVVNAQWAYILWNQG